MITNHIEEICEEISICLAYNTPQPPKSVHKKCQPNRFCRLAGFTQHIYECLVLLYG